MSAGLGNGTRIGALRLPTPQLPAPRRVPSAPGGRVGVVGIVPSLGDARAPFFSVPNFTIVGLTDRAIQEARERVRASVRK
jgi:hypothetical protein